MNSLNLWNVSLVWITFGQVSVCLLIGITASYLWSRNAARAHRLLSLSIAAAITMPALSFGVSQVGWGQIVRSEQPAVETVVEISEPTYEKTVMNNHQSRKPTEPTWTAGTIQEGTQRATVLPAQPAEFVQTGEASTNQISIILPAVWAILSVVLLFRLMTSIVQGRRVLSRAKPIADPAISQAQLSASSALGLRVAPRLLVSSDVCSPVIWCWGRRPALLLPKLLGAAADWIGVLCHELAHWKRRDHLWALMSQTLTILLPWNPLCWWARRRLENLSEQACDDWALAGGTSPADYAESLLNFLPQNRPQLALAAVRNKKGLVVRLKRILTNRKVNPVAGRKWTCSATAVAMLLVATIALAQVREETQKDNPKETAQSQTDKLSANKGAKNSTTNPGQFVQVSGVVLKPDGSPAKGATVRAASTIWAEGVGFIDYMEKDFQIPMTVTTTDDHGRFTISINTQPLGNAISLDPAWIKRVKMTSIAASVDGFGAAWGFYDGGDSSEPVTLQLGVDIPIKGRVIDLEGRPVAGTSVIVSKLRLSKGEDLTKWLSSIKAGEFRETADKHAWHRVVTKLIGIPEKVTTRNDGSFEIHGIGKECIVTLEFGDEKVAFQKVIVVTRKMKPFQKMIQSGYEKTEPVFGAEFTFTAEPTRPIEGIVIDAKTGKPLPGVVVNNYQLSNNRYTRGGAIQDTTNEKGEFRLIGIPKGQGNSLLVLPNLDQPYFEREVDVPNPAGIKAVSMKIELHRGIWITGRVTDKVTAEPVSGVQMDYMPFRSNKYAQALPEFRDNGQIDGYQDRYMTNRNGEYKLVGLPGRAVVGATSYMKSYLQGVGYKEIDAPKYPNTDNLITYMDGGGPGPKWPSVMGEIDPANDTQTVKLDLQLDPGTPVKIYMTDEAGKPVTGADIKGPNLRTTNYVTSKTHQMTFYCDPDKTLTTIIHHKGRNIGRIVRIGPKEVKNGELYVKLLPCATVTGRLLSKGDPLPGLVIRADVLPIADFGKSLPPVSTDTEGRFTCTIVPGCQCILAAYGNGLDLFATISPKLAIEPGETKNFGTMTLGKNRNFIPVDMK